MTDAPRPAEDRSMNRVYGLAVFCHAAVIAILWWFGRTFSS
jgi:hypothetical protein